ncbi:AAA family ATPase [Streptomyces sp. NBC_00203]|uniref:AAA family ATPase n=1 Tax=Streptomyces sp. NBC_00203 TaxID=2975680 RepID=UPI003250C6C5
MLDATRVAAGEAVDADAAQDDAVASDDGAARGPVDELAGLLAFRRLDLLLATGVAAARQRYGPDAGADSFRGLYLSEEQVRRSLLVPAALPLAAIAGPPANPLPRWPEIEADNPRWSWLRRRYDLGDRELDAVLLTLGPDVDRRYEQLYGYLQDDVSARRPTVNLVLDLLTTSPADRLRTLGLFAPDAPLLRHRLVALLNDPRALEPPLIARVLAADEQITAALLGVDCLDRRLAPCCEVIRPEPPPGRAAGLDPADGEAGSGAQTSALAAVVREAWGRRPLRLCFHGPAGTGRKPTARAIAEQLGLPLLVVDVPALAQDAVAVPERLQLALREAELRDALVYLDGADAFLPEPGRAGSGSLATVLAAHQGVIFLGTAEAWAPPADHPLGVLNIAFTRPGAAERLTIWRQALSAADAKASALDVSAVADRFRLSPGQIRDAALTASAAARLRGAGRDGEPRLSTEDLFAAARQERGQDLTAFARRVRLVHRWDDLVVPDEVQRQLHELTMRVQHRTRVLDEWGFDRKLSGGKGITALFAGPPGTGKTMATSVIAAELGLDLFAIDLSMVVSKYVGETEKNLARVFEAATDTDAVLFFDEADALFGKRSEVRDAHDRYANIEIAYLLQRMEQYDGLAVLATNLRHHLDEAFTRRLHIMVDFPFPDVTERLRIWRTCLPAQTPLEPDVDLAELARFRLAGANIKNVVLGAAFLAAAEGVPVGRQHLVDASRREHHKMGKVLTDLEPQPPPDP